jgi:hypothetical protein
VTGAVARRCLGFDYLVLVEEQVDAFGAH